MKQIVNLGAIVALALFMGSCAAGSQQAAVAETPAEGEFFTMEVHGLNHAGLNIYGQLYLPRGGEAKKPLALLAHGYNSSTREVEAYAEVLARRGIACYAFEFCGGATRSRSEGSTLEMSVFTEADDVAAVCRMVKSWDFVDSTRVSLLGCSQGGLVAAIASSQMPDAFRSVVLVYPALMIGEDAVNRHPKEAITSETGVNVMGMLLSHVYYDRLVGYHIYDELSKYKKEVMIVCGDQDPIAAGESIERARQQYTSCEVHIIPGGSHGFPEPEAHRQAEAFVADFLTRTLL